MSIKNNINTYADLTAYNADTNKDYPNVSYIQGTDEVKYVGEDPALITLTLRTNGGTDAKLTNTTTNFSKMWVDGVEQENVTTNYTFTIGNHIVIYKLIDYSIIIEDNFLNCGWLKTITIRDSVTEIKNSAFRNCENLDSITIYATTPPTLYYNPTNKNNGAFYNTNNCPIYVPAESVNAYKTAQYWSNIASRIQSITE